MKICTIETGRPPEPLDETFPDYPRMVSDWLSPQLPEASFSSVSALDNEDMPAAERFDAYVVTGSRYGVYDDQPWIEPLKAFLVAAKKARRPVFGICFGHQVMAEAYGGKAVKSDRGWGVGVHDYTHAGPVSPGDNAAFVFHQDQVIALPPGATNLGGADHCPIGVVGYDFPALSVQYHPEFSRAYMEALLDVRGLVLPPEVTAKARSALAAMPVDNAPAARWVADFFREHVARLAA